jgi:hypothetical protein
MLAGLRLRSGRTSACRRDPRPEDRHDPVAGKLVDVPSERAELEMAMREHGVESVQEVKLAVLETDGSISIVPKSSPVVHTRKHIRQFRRH